MNSVSDLRSYSRNWVKEFIAAYKKETCLWQTTHQDYNNTIVRNIAYDKLVEKLKDVESNPDRSMVVKKINSLRSAFRREYRKKLVNSNYASKLWYYEALAFIALQSPGNKVKNGRKSKIQGKKLYKSEPVELSESLCGDEVLIDIEENEIDQLNESDQNDETEPEEDHHENEIDDEKIDQKHQVRLLKISNVQNEVELQEAVNAIESNRQSPTIYHQEIIENSQQHPQSTATHSIQSIQLSKEQLHSLLNTSNTSSLNPINNILTKDEFDAIGVNIACKLRCLNPSQRIIAEKLISDVLFNAQLEMLMVTSKITSE